MSLLSASDRVPCSFRRLVREGEGRGLFGEYPHLKKLHHARTNLTVTLQLSEFFYTIPQRAEALIK